MAVGSISQILPEPGWRIATKPRSREHCFTSALPLYSANLHSPLRTAAPFTIYFEGEILPGNTEDNVHLALGFVAGKDRVLRMPGFERGTIGFQCRDGRLCVGNNVLKDAKTAAFEPGNLLGFGMTLSKSEMGSSSSPAIDAEIFVTREGSLIGTWKLQDLGENTAVLEGFEGGHDIYAAVGTSREVHVDILFERKDWQYAPAANAN